MKVNIYVLISLKLIIVCNAQTWSTWTSCSYPEPCQNKTKLICDNGRGIQCAQNGGSPHQITLSVGCSESCDGFNHSQWKAVYNSYSCQGNCYDSITITEHICKINQTCKRHRYRRCYNESTCRGIWKETSSQCSSSCGGGTRSMIITCVNQTTGQESSHCNGTFFGTYTQINISQHTCNTHACPATTKGNEPASSTNFPIVYVVAGCGGFVVLIIVAIIVYVIKKKSTPKKSTKDLSSSSDHAHGIDVKESKEINNDYTCVNVDTTTTEPGDMYTTVNKTNKKTNKTPINKQDTVATGSGDMYAAVNKKKDLAKEDSGNNKDTAKAEPGDMYARVNKTNKKINKTPEKKQDQSTHVTVESGDVYAVVEKK